jgi:hypothetical protein
MATLIRTDHRNAFAANPLVAAAFTFAVVLLFGDLLFHSAIYSSQSHFRHGKEQISHGVPSGGFSCSLNRSPHSQQEKSKSGLEDVERIIGVVGCT